MNRLSSRSAGAVLAALTAVGMCVIGTGTAQAQTADLHFDCVHTSQLTLMGNNLIVSGLNCTGPVGTEWGTITGTTTHVAYFCDPLTGSNRLGSVSASGSFCEQL
jgi:hypothetical protein